MRKRTRRTAKNNKAISIVATVAVLGMSLGVVPGEISAADKDQQSDPANAPGAAQYKDKRSAGGESVKLPGAAQYKDKSNAGAEYQKSPMNAPGAMQYKDKTNAGAESVKSPMNAPGAAQTKKEETSKAFKFEADDAKGSPENKPK